MPPDSRKLSPVSELVKRLEEEDRRFFLICSFGRTATHWIAETLSMQPDTFCGHGGDFKKSHRELGIGYQFYHKRKNPRPPKTNIESWVGLYFEHLDYTTCRNVGNVHAMNNYRVAAERAKIITDRIIPVLITRDPIQRITSGWRQMLKEVENPGRDASLLEEIRQIHWSSIKHKVHLVKSFPDLLFLTSVAIVARNVQNDYNLITNYYTSMIRNRLSKLDCAIFEFEILTQQQGITALAELILGQGNVDKAAIRRSVANGPIASATMKVERQDPTALWPDWGAKVVQSFFEKDQPARRAIDFFEYEWKLK